MRIDVLTVLPEIHVSPLQASILGRARAEGLLDVRVHDIRDWTTDRHRITDDAPYGGGGGMVMKAEPVVRAARGVRAMLTESLGAAASEVPLIHMSPQGERFSASLAEELARLPGIILLCGCYEGIDERAVEMVVDREISIGDYVLTSGDLAALVVINAVARHVPGVVGNSASVENDSFADGLLDYPHYTRPEVFEGRAVPPVLLGGHHAKLTEWRRRESLRRTLLRRPDLLAHARLNAKDRKVLAELEAEARALAEAPATQSVESNEEG